MYLGRVSDYDREPGQKEDEQVAVKVMSLPIKSRLLSKRKKASGVLDWACKL